MESSAWPPETSRRLDRDRAWMVCACSKRKEAHRCVKVSVWREREKGGERVKKNARERVNENTMEGGERRISAREWVRRFVVVENDREWKSEKGSWQEREGERVTFFGESAINVGSVHSGWKLEEMRKNWKKPPRNVSKKLWFARDGGSSSGSGVFCYRSFSWRHFSSRRFNRSCFVITVIEIESHEATKNLQLILDSSSLSTSTATTRATTTTSATTTSATSKPWDNQCCAVLHLTVLVSHSWTPFTKYL